MTPTPSLERFAEQAIRIASYIWDSTPDEQRFPYVESVRKDGYVFAVKRPGQS